MNLARKHCVPCKKGSPALSQEQEEKMLKLIRQAQSLSDNRRRVQHDNIGSGWLLLREGTHKLRREFKFKNFREAMRFVNKVADIAEAEGHHPNIKIVYNKVQLDLFTHAVGGLSENDFIMASKIDGLGN